MSQIKKQTIKYPKGHWISKVIRKKWGLSEIYSIITSRCKCEIDEFNEKKNKQILTKLRNFLPDKNTGNNLNEISEKKLFTLNLKATIIVLISRLIIVKI